MMLVPQPSVCLALWLTTGFQESRTRVINMDDDDPDALEAFIQYLHTSGTSHIQNWKISYGSSLVDKERPKEADDFAHRVLYGWEYGELPRGYFPFLANVLVLADKYEQPLLAEAVAAMFKVPEEMEGRNSTRRVELYDACDREPLDVIEALAILTRLPSECESKWNAQSALVKFFGVQGFIKFPTARPVTELKAWEAVPPDFDELSLASIVVQTPGLFSTVAGHCQKLLREKLLFEMKTSQLEIENDRLKRERRAAEAQVRAAARGHHACTCNQGCAVRGEDDSNSEDDW